MSTRYDGRGEPSNVAAINQRIRQLAKDSGQPDNRMRHRLGVVVLAEIMADLTIGEDDERLLIKGGTAMMLRFGLESSRFSKDLDAMLRGAIEPFIERLQERGREPHHGWTFTVAKSEVIEVPGMIAKPRRLSIKMAYKGRSFSTIQLEIAPEEGAAATEYDELTADDLANLGFETGASVQQVLTIRYQVAQKLHACTSRTEGRLNDRAHDLVDLALLEEYVRENPAAVREACQEIFEIRDAHPWPPSVEAEPHWGPIYARAVEGLEDVAPRDLEDAVVLVQALVDHIENKVSVATRKS